MEGVARTLRVAVVWTRSLIENLAEGGGGGGGGAPDIDSQAPKSHAAPWGRAVPPKSVLKVAMVVAASIAGEADWSLKLVARYGATVLTKSGLTQREFGSAVAILAQE